MIIGFTCTLGLGLANSLIAIFRYYHKLMSSLPPSLSTLLPSPSVSVYFGIPEGLSSNSLAHLEPRGRKALDVSTSSRLIQFGLRNGISYIEGDPILGERTTADHTGAPDHQSRTIPRVEYGLDIF